MRFESQNDLKVFYYVIGMFSSTRGGVNRCKGLSPWPVCRRRRSIKFLILPFDTWVENFLSGSNKYKLLSPIIVFYYSALQHSRSSLPLLLLLLYVYILRWLKNMLCQYFCQRVWSMSADQMKWTIPHINATRMVGFSTL